LVHGKAIPLKKGITIIENKMWNRIAIHISWFGCNVEIENWICIHLFGIV
jgi:hypothetical protein